MPDEDIDYSDSPEVPANLFKLMKKAEPVKIKTRINDVLLAMVHDYKKAHSQ